MLARSMLTSLGQLKFRHRGCLDAITKLLTAKLEDAEGMHDNVIQNKDLSAFLLCTAALNYCPPKSDKLYQAVIDNLTQATIAENVPNSEVVWLNVVWSLAVLNKTLPHHLESVLSSEFYNKLLYSHDHRNVNVILRLLNVNAVASLKTDYPGPTIAVSDDPLLRDVKVAPRKDKTTFTKKAMEDFSKLACPPTFLLPDVNTLMGFEIEGEVVFDQNVKPLAIAGISVFGRSVTGSNQTKQLPEGSTRVAVMCLGYHDCLADGMAPSGSSSLCIQLLKLKGFKVLVIMPSTFHARQQTLDRIKTLESKLKNLLITQTPPTES